MKKILSAAVPATLICAVAGLILSGCDSDSVTRDCVDANGNVLPDSACTNGTTVFHGGGGYSYPHYVYGGTRSGGQVLGGSTSDPGVSYTIVSGSSGDVVRGGFGGFGEGHGFGGDGGHGGGE